jgi:hypothetical protein
MAAYDPADAITERAESVTRPMAYPRAATRG